MTTLDDDQAASPSRERPFDQGHRSKEDFSRLSSEQQRVLDDIAASWADHHAEDISRCYYWMTDESWQRLVDTKADGNNDCVTPRDVYEKFYKTYAQLEEQQASKEDAAGRERWQNAIDVRDAYTSINDKLRDSLALLDEVDAEREQVVEKTTQLHKRCEKMMRDHNVLEVTAESISSKLAIFDDVNKITRQMSLLSSGNTDDVSELFPPSVDTAEGLQDLFHRLDTITAFMEEHYDYQMAPACLSQISHLRSRACFAVRSHLMRLLDEAGRELKTVGSHEEVCKSLYQGYQDARAAEVRPIIDVLNSVCCGNDDYVATIYAVHQYYCTVRQAHVSERINSMLDDMAAGEGNDENILEGEESQILPYTRHVCRQVLSLAKAECRTYTQYFGGDASSIATGSPSASQSTGLAPGADEPIEGFLSNCYGKPLYAFLRSKIVSCQKVETLKSLAELISREILAPEGFDSYDINRAKQPPDADGRSEENSLLVPVLSVVYRLLKDVQERLIYRTQTYIRDDIRGFVPSKEDLEYPLRLFEHDALTVHPEVDAYGRLMRVSTRGWYPTLGKTLWILAEILPVLETTTFQSLAYEAVSACLETIDIAAVDIARSYSEERESYDTPKDNNDVDGWTTLNEALFTIRHLLILREQIASFDVDLVSSSQYLDFSNVKHSLMDVLSLRLPGHQPSVTHQGWGVQQQQHSTGSAFNVPSRILSTLTPVIQSRQSDVKRDIEAQLKSACDRLIAHITARLTIPLTTVYVAKTPPCDDERPSADDIEAAWKSTIDKVEADIPVVVSMMRAYLTLSEPSAVNGSDSSTSEEPHDSTTAILFQPIHVRVVDVCRELERNGLSHDTSVSSTDLSCELSRLFDKTMEQSPEEVESVVLRK